MPAPEEENRRHALHLFTLLLKLEDVTCSRDDILMALHKDNVGTGVHYTALHLHPYYRQTYKYLRGDYPNAEFISDRTFSIPLSAKLTDEEVEGVILTLKRILEYYSK